MVVKKMKQFQLVHLVILVLLTTSFTEALSYAKRGCKDTCGEVSIPYPFGIGAGCSINEWYNIDCNNSTPYLSAFSNMEVLWVSLEIQMVVINVPLIADRQNPVLNSSNILTSDHGESPFLFCKLHNKLVVEGCGHALMSMHDGTIVNGCSSTCHSNDTIFGDINKCFGDGCCQTTIPHYLESFTLNLTCLESAAGGYEVCRSAFLMNDNSVFGKNFSLRSIPRDGGSVPIGFFWTLTERDYLELNGCSVIDMNISVNVGDPTLMKSFKCECGVGRYGNPYLEDGCEVPESCEGCELTGGRCIYETTVMDGIQFRGFNCLNGTISDHVFGSNKISVGVILGISISMGLLFMTFISYLLYKVIKKTKVKRQKERFFKRNGGLLIKQQEATYNTGLVDRQTILFTSKELEKATDHFNDNRILGRGGQGTVYKGMLADGRIVAVKKSKVVDERQLEQFINEVVVLSQVNHRNVVKLLGCCLETDVPLLVSEFIPNGTLYDLIHDDTIPFSWNMRLQIATEVAGALSYLHSATSIPIYHRDIKTTNILLDEKFRAKISDFGTSRFVSIDETHLTTLVRGTFGYMDPEYFQSSQLTEKSDVYSFGVVLLELLTREKPISLTRFVENKTLAMHFTLAMEDGSVMSILDTKIVEEGCRDELLAVANLAMRCLNFNGKYRPTMKEVATELEGMRMLHMPPTVETNFGQLNYNDDQCLTYDGSTTTMSFKSTPE
ncbi:LOW QUALITY PROTEIN: hypothetical protein OSB04_027776 [Centaurea solstitialis]|uniref:Protein kinase domain-containing protein n=1 Tax=Centaurea solstitialis TaxID=347529 RepID=A0AA38SRY5_9ASTR|nr:LOW QUALITY PROTEIN: hypothetical protein OSB04_027776 [Centaurea solstitialis]